MKYRRCAHLVIELENKPRFSLESILSGGDGLDRNTRLLATSAHRDQSAELSIDQLAILQALSPDQWCSLDELCERFDGALIAQLIELEFLLSDQSEKAPAAQRDEQYRSTGWWPLAAAAATAGRWHDINTEAAREKGEFATNADMVAANGLPPEHCYRRAGDESVLDLPQPQPSALDQWLDERRTCRNFDTAAPVSNQTLSDLLHRVWGASGVREIHPNIFAIRKNVPGGGALHGTEVYALIQHVEGFAPGIYHYECVEHRLNPVRLMDADEAAKLLHQMVAGQNWFSPAPLVFIMTARFDRLFWKYRAHAKAWRVCHLDVGHLSQLFYMSAHDLGLGAFITAAINDSVVEQALDLDRMREAPLAVVGCGYRSSESKFVEFDKVSLTEITRRKRSMPLPD